MNTFLTINLNPNYLRDIEQAPDGTHQFVYSEINNLHRIESLQKVTFWFGSNINNVVAIKLDVDDPPIIKMINSDAPNINMLTDGIVFCFHDGAYKAVVLEFKSTCIDEVACAYKMYSATAILNMILAYYNCHVSDNSQKIRRLRAKYFLFYLLPEEQRIQKQRTYNNGEFDYFTLPGIHVSSKAYKIPCFQAEETFKFDKFIDNNYFAHRIENQIED